MEGPHQCWKSFSSIPFPESSLASTPAERTRIIPQPPAATRNQPQSSQEYFWGIAAVMPLLKLTEMRDVSLEEIQRAALCWAREQRTNPKAQSYGSFASFFVCAAEIRTC